MIWVYEAEIDLEFVSEIYSEKYHVHATCPIISLRMIYMA